MILKHVYKFFNTLPNKGWGEPYVPFLGTWAGGLLWQPQQTECGRIMFRNYVLVLFVMVVYILPVSFRTFNLGASRGSLGTLGPHVEKPCRKCGTPLEPSCFSPISLSLPSPGTRQVSEEAFEMTSSQPLSVCLQTCEISQVEPGQFTDS